MTTKELCMQWLENQKTRVKIRTRNRYEELLLHHIVPSLGDREIHTVTRKDVRMFLQENTHAQSEAKRSCATMNMCLTVLRNAFSYAVDWELISENPCLGIKRLSYEEKKVKAFTKDEQRRLEKRIFECGDRRLFGVVICLYTGLRIGELLALTWDCVDLRRGTIAICKTVYRAKDESGTWHVITDRPKTENSERIIPIPPFLKQMFSAHKNGAVGRYVIENTDGSPISTRSYQYIYSRLTESAKVPPYNFHVLRHTFATRAIECSMDIKTLSELLGHKSAVITLNRYAHSMLETKILMMKKLKSVYLA